MLPKIISVNKFHIEIALTFELQLTAESRFCDWVAYYYMYAKRKIRK